MENLLKQAAPLPERLRPTTLDDFVGQEHLRDKIDNFLQAKRLPCILLVGPPGCGKSTLALLLANASKQPYVRVSAPEAGLQQLRKSLGGVKVLILDELHRFSKAQQDFFLPILESGELTLIATTTENPSFSVTKQLLSRLHVLRLRSLLQPELVKLAKRGAESQNLNLDDEILGFLCSASCGDARSLLNLIEYVGTLPKAKQNIEEIKKSLPEIMIRHDKDGDSHYEIISALIKSIRGSDPDAALYYLAALLEGGEDPRFISRRLIILAAEDVGLADPQALSLAVACQQAVEHIGMPEGYLPLAETCIYLALTKKSNSAYAAYMNAAKEIKANGVQAVPMHLRNASTRLQKEWGYGKGYIYPHNYPESWVEQDYLPENLSVKRFYMPRNNGEESRLSTWWKKNKQK